MHILTRNDMAVPVDVNVLYFAADYAISHWFSARLQQGDRLNNDLFKFGDTALTLALPQSPVQDLSFLAQEVRDTSRGVRGPGRVSALAESDASGPAPGIIQLELPLELRTVAAH